MSYIKSFFYRICEKDLIEKDIPNRIIKWTTGKLDKELPNSKTRELFASNIDLYSSYGWCDSNGEPLPLLYQQDQYGFRNDITYQDGVPIAIGCSDTYGIGNNLEDRWSNVLGRYLHKDIINLGLPGGSIKGCYRILKGYLEEYTPSQVYLLTPSPYRSEFNVYSKDTGEVYVQIGPGFHKAMTDELEPLQPFVHDIFDKIYSLKHNTQIEYQAYIDAIKNICSEKSIKIIGVPNPIFDRFDPLELTKEQKQSIGPAYDLQHRGPNYQRFIAEHFIKLIENNEYGITNYTDNIWR